ncbi:MAG: hypothetical protein ACHQ49_08340 [Elusimicrobiota bacterium]
MKRICLLATVVLSGCATQSLQVTSMAYSPDTMQVLGPARGQITQDYFFCVPFLGNDNEDPLDAIAKALKPNAADALLNPAIQTEFLYFFPFYCRKRVTASGIAVKLNRPALPGASKP